MTIKERLIVMEMQIADIGAWADESIARLEREVEALEERNAELAQRIDNNEDQVCDIWECILEEEMPVETTECDCSMCKEARAEVDKEEDEMTRTKLCDVYENCWECPEADVCFDAVVDDDTEQLLEEGCDICDDCEGCPLEEECTMQSEAYWRRFTERM